MKIKMFKAAILGATVAALGLGATSAQAATASATARAKILRQVTLTNTSDLQFGTIVSTTTASTVVISTAGARTCGSGLVCSGTTTAAGFDLTGTTGQVVNITVPASITLASGANTMNASLASSASTVTLAAGTNTFSVGGTLSVGANQADGDYSVSFNVTADYQ